MRILVLGCGLVGKELARQLRADGHFVIGTTTTPAKQSSLKNYCDDVRVLRGSDTAAAHAAIAEVDAVAVTAGPSPEQAQTPEQRQKYYHKVLVETAKSVASAAFNGPVVTLSSFAVYGDAGSHLDAIDEDSPLTDSKDASPLCFQLAEKAYGNIADRACIFRCPDIAGGDDLPIREKVKMAHQFLGGSVPFHDEALFYRINQLDVVRAIKFALDHKLTGIYNLTHTEVPPPNKTYFDALGKLDGLPSLIYRNEMKGPVKPVSNAKLYATGFRLKHTQAERMPDADTPPTGTVNIDRSASDMTLKVLERLVNHFNLKEIKHDGEDCFMPLTAQGGAIDGQRVGELRVFRGGPIHKLIYSGLTIESFGMDTHQIYAFTTPDSCIPHFTIDAAISPNTNGTFHIGIDLLPKVDLGASLDYMREVYGPLSEKLAEARDMQGVSPATTLTPLHLALRSNWMLAAFVDKTGMHKLQAVLDHYLEHWITLAERGLSEAAQNDSNWQNPARRDRLNRQAFFNPETNFVWTLLERLLGSEQTATVRETFLKQEI